MGKPFERSRLRLMGTVAPVVLLLVLAAILAVQAMTAERARHETAVQTVRDYADFAAFILANRAWQELEQRLLYAFAPLRVWRAVDRAAMPPAAMIHRDRYEAARCAIAGDTMPVLARLVLDPRALELDGPGLAPAGQRWLADTLAAIAGAEPADETRFGHVFEGTRPGRLWAYVIMRDSAGRALAVYAKTSCLYAQDVPVFQRAMQGPPALPPSLTGFLPNDSLFSVRAMGPDGRRLWSSSEEPASAIHGSAIAPRLGGVRLEVAIRPAIADALVWGGLPAYGPPAALVLLALSLALGVFTIVQIRRQQELMRTRERFVSNVSRELRTPLQQILVFSELMRMDRLRTDEERRHSIEVVERETHRLIQLVDNVLQFSRAVRGGDTLALEPVELAPLARETIQAFEPLGRARDVTVRLECEEGIAARADAAALRRILLNLLDNAVKYGPRGQTVRVTIRHIGSDIRIAIEDQGPGVPHEDRARVFRPFQRLEREEHSAVAGSGVGLAIVKDLADRMNGDIGIEDASGGGARFVIRLSAADLRSRAPHAASRDEAGAHHTP
ncbi:MAG: HAMP domain-containing histidine kinase [Gemmatimonadetes bacterium]|nr:HAMP domain-containing histidine kinase [Gemmatimonadota bacterium]